MLNTLKPQTDEVTLIVPLKSCWMPLDTQHPPNHRSSPSIIEARTIQVYGGSTLQPTGPPNNLMKDTTGYPQQGCDRVELNLIQDGASMDWTCSSMSHWCLSRLGSDWDLD